MSRSQTLTAPQLGGTFVDRIAPNDLKANQTPSQSNTRISGTSFTPRPGYSQLADELTSGTKVYGLASYLRTTSANSRLVANYNAGLYSIDPDNDSSWTAITNTITSDSRMEFVNHNDLLFCFNGVDEPGQLSGTTYTEPFTAPDSLATATFLPAFGDEYIGSLWVAGVPSKPNVVYYSKASTAASPDLLTDFSGALTNPGDAGAEVFDNRVTAIRRRLGILVIFTETSAEYIQNFTDLGSTFVPLRKPLEGSHGAVGQASTTLVEDDIYYLTPKKEIRSVVSDLQSQGSPVTRALSDDFRNTMQALDDDQSGAVSYYDRGKKLYKLWVKTRGASFNDLCIVRDLANGGQWMIDRAKFMSAGVYHKGQAYVGSGLEGKIFLDEAGTADDGSVPISTRWLTKQYNGNDPTTEKTWRRVTLFGRQTKETTQTAQVFVDNVPASAEITIDSNDLQAGDVGAIGDFAVGDEAVGEGVEASSDLVAYTKIIPIRSSGKNISVLFKSSGTNNNFENNYISIEVIPRSKQFNKNSEKL